MLSSQFLTNKLWSFNSNRILNRLNEIYLRSAVVINEYYIFELQLPGRLPPIYHCCIIGHRHSITSTWKASTKVAVPHNHSSRCRHSPHSCWHRYLQRQHHPCHLSAQLHSRVTRTTEHDHGDYDHQAPHYHHHPVKQSTWPYCWLYVCRLVSHKLLSTTGSVEHFCKYYV